MTIAEGNVGVAFGLTFASGAATMLGASVVFFPKLVKLASRRVLAGSLGFSAGVMIYISFVDIFQKSVDAFTLEGMDEARAYGFATLCLFTGVLVMKIVEIIVHRLSGDHHPNRRDFDEDIQITWNENEGHCEMNEAEEEEFIVPHCIGCSADPVGDLKKWQEIADAEIYKMDHQHETSTRSASTVTNGSLVMNDEENGGVDVLPTVKENNDGFQDNESKTFSNFASLPHGLPQSITASGKVAASDIGEEEGKEIKAAKDEKVFRAPVNSQLSPTEEKKKLVRMGLTTAAAIAVHNFPEGLATFVAALTDPSSGVLLAIAIGAHNIPEGLCVSLPIYYATGSRWKGFSWGVISGMAEPVAAIMGYIVLANAISDTIYAVLFGLVSGMMIMISSKELLPTAHRYDPEDTVVTTCTISGMAVMALSLVLFKIV
jgi:ZIP family zinc transporter